MSKSSDSTVFLTETDRMLARLDAILVSIKGKEGAIDYKAVKDGFDKTRLQIHEQLREAETFMTERDKLFSSVNPKEIMERNSLEKKIEELLEVIEKKMKDLEVELNAQKNKPGKYGDVSNKEKMYKLMEEKYRILRNKLDGIDVTEKEIEDNRTCIEKLDAILQVQSGGEPERELYEEEKAKMEEWERKKAEQDKGLDQIHDLVKDIRNEAKLAEQNIDQIGKTVKKVSAHTDKTQTQLESQNKKLKDLLNKFRSGDKICVDIILILVVLGLIAVLYSIIKTKYF